MIRAMLIIGGAALIVGLTLYTLLDAVRTPAHEARTLPKWLWVLVTLLFPVVGPLMWLILGRPKAQPAAGTPRPRLRRQPKLLYKSMQVLFSCRIILFKLNLEVSVFGNKS